MTEHENCTSKNHDLPMKHEQRIATVEEGVKSLKSDIEDLGRRFTNLDDFKELLWENNTHIKVLAERMSATLETINRHDERLEKIETNMETKESYARLHGHFEELEAMYNKDKKESQASKLNEYEDMKRYITRLLLGALIFVIGALVIFAIVILIGLAEANGGHIPLPPN